MKQIIGLSLILGLILSCNPKSKEAFPPPNIVLIQVDDLGYDDLSLHGNQLIETPNIDKLGNQSLRYNHFYLQCLCAPSRAALLTGRNYQRTGVSGVHAGRDYINLNETLISDVLKSGGYITGMWGKWHSGKTNGYFPWDRGFDEAYYSCLYNYFDNEGLLNGKHIKTEGYATDAITNMAIKFIEENKDSTFFAYISHLAPHNPWRAPKKNVDKYLKKGLSEPMSLLYGMIDNMDDNIGRVLDKIHSLGIEQNTVVIFISDNGPWTKSYRFGLTDKEWELRNPNGFKGSKGTNWDNGIKSPLFIKWGNKIKQGNVEEIVKIEDLFPSILKIAGIPVPDSLQLDGQDISPTFEGGKMENSTVFISHPTPRGERSYLNELDKSGSAVPFTKTYKSSFQFKKQRLSIIKPDYKYIMNENGTKEALYNIRQDPKEQNNILTNFNSIGEQMRLELKNWYQQVHASANSFTMPVFQIGYQNRIFNQIYACAPANISGELINKEHFLANWNKAGDSAMYKINVHTEGKYKAYLIHKIVNYQNLTFDLISNKSRVSAKLKDSENRNFGTLLENESAYWEDFDLKETFKKDIIKSYLGEIELTKTSQQVTLLLSDISKGHISENLDQIIAIHLVKK